MTIGDTVPMGEDGAPPMADLEIEAPVTGDEDIDRVLSQLAAHAGAPLEHQLTVVEAVHRTLQDRLADVEG
jgi:hypothetical protein